MVEAVGDKTAMIVYRGVACLFPAIGERTV
jgi:hypothetical protein